MNLKPAAFVITIAVMALFIMNYRMKEEPLKVVPDVDLDRYAGVWYEVARLPNRFEEKCAGDVTATYTRKGKEIEVVNRCRKKDGEFTSAKGVARVEKKEGPSSRLKVRFAPAFLSFLPFVWGDYQIMELAPDYSYALVGEPERKYLWILSRTPEMDQATYDKLKKAAAAQGFDVSRLIKVEHGLA